MLRLNLVTLLFLVTESCDQAGVGHGHCQEVGRAEPRSVGVGSGHVEGKRFSSATPAMKDFFSSRFSNGTTLFSPQKEGDWLQDGPLGRGLRGQVDLDPGRRGHGPEPVGDPHGHGHQAAGGHGAQDQRGVQVQHLQLGLIQLFKGERKFGRSGKKDVTSHFLECLFEL